MLAAEELHGFPEYPAVVDEIEQAEPGAARRVEVVDAVVGRGVDDAGAGVERHVLAVIRSESRA